MRPFKGQEALDVGRDFRRGSDLIEAVRCAGALRFRPLVEKAGIEVVMVDRERAYVASKAFSRFGRGDIKPG